MSLMETATSVLRLRTVKINMDPSNLLFAALGFALMTFDWSINLGHVLSLLGTLITVVWAVGRFQARFETMRQQVNELRAQISEDLKAGGEIKEKLAVIEYRIGAQEKEVSRARDNIHNLANFLQQGALLKKPE